MKLFRAVSKLLSAQLVASVSFACVAIVTSRMLGPDGRGVYAFFFTMSGLLSNVFNLGIAQANVYCINKEGTELSIIIGNSIVILLFQIFVLTIFLFYFGGDLFGELNVGKPQIIIILWVSTFLQILDIIVGGVILGRHAYNLYSMNLMLQSFSICIASLPILFFNVSIFEMLIFRLTAMSLILLWYILKMISLIELEQLKFSVKTCYFQIKFGFKNNIQNIIGLLNYKIYLLFVGYLLGAKEVGFISIALLFVEGIRYMPNALGSILFPKLTELTVKDSNNFTAQVLRLTLLFSFLLLICVLSMVDIIMEYVFGLEFLESSLLIIVMLAGGVFGVTYQILSRYFTSQKLQGYTIACGIYGLLISCILLFCFHYIFSLGILSAGFSFLACNFLVAILMCVFFHRITNMPYRNFLIITPYDFNLIKELLNKLKNKLFIQKVYDKQ